MIAPVTIVGLDLSGPGSPGETALVWFAAEGEQLVYRGHLSAVSDAAALQLVTMLAAQGEVAVGMDAPLSYNDGGGFRPGDVLLRQVLTAANAHGLAVVSPTMPRAAGITLRGVALTRLFAGVTPRPQVVEVHPGAAMALRGAKLEWLRMYRTRQPGAGTARASLRAWLGQQGLAHLPELSGSPHLTDACGAALATWQWRLGKPAWLHPAEPPLHPYDFVA